MLRSHGLWGCDAHTQRVPPAVFRLPRPRLARFLNRLFATDGTAWVARSATPASATPPSSERLARDVAHALLRFGVRTKLRRRAVRYRSERRPAFEVEIMDAGRCMTFVDEIGILGKDACRRRGRGVADAAACGFSLDTVPVAVWDDIIKAKGDRSWAEVNRRCGRPASHNWHPYRGRVRRETVGRLAEALDDDQLRWWASPDVRGTESSRSSRRAGRR